MHTPSHHWVDTKCNRAKLLKNVSKYSKLIDKVLILLEKLNQRGTFQKHSFTMDCNGDRLKALILSKAGPVMW
jgi:hypothetical protein